MFSCVLTFTGKWDYAGDSEHLSLTFENTIGTTRGYVCYFDFNYCAEVGTLFVDLVRAHNFKHFIIAGQACSESQKKAIAKPPNRPNVPVSYADDCKAMTWAGRTWQKLEERYIIYIYIYISL
jgi:hypothetical protein